MARDGSGTYNLPSVAIVAAHSLTNSSNFNTTITDIAAALTQSISSDGQTTPTANLNMGGNRHTNVGFAQARTDYTRVAEEQDDSYHWGGTAGGTSNALTINPSPPIAMYVAGQRFTFLVGAAVAGGTVTLAVNGLTPVTIVYPRWAANTVIEVVYGAVYFYQIGGGSAMQEIPYGSSMIFRATTAPAGWTQNTDINDSLLRMVSGTGGATGGNWAISGLSLESATHTHAYSASTAAAVGNTFNATTGGGGATGNTSVHAHAFTGTTGLENTNHNHTGDGTWRPAYLDVISCWKN